MAQLATLFGDPANQPILVIAPFEQLLIDSMLHNGHRLQLAMPEALHNEQRQLLNDKAEQVTFIDLKKGIYFPEGNIRDIITFSSLFEEQKGEKFFEEWVENVYQILHKGQSWYIIIYTEDAKSYGIKPTALESDRLQSIAYQRFNGKIDDIQTIPGIRLLKFTK